jgi:GGDEF domain-containing protein
MRIFDQIDPPNLDQRQWELCMLALAVILILAVGMALLMYPAALSNDLIISGTTKRKIFFGFCSLSVLLVGYLLDRQVVISRLRQRVAEEQRRIAAMRHEASRDLLATLPGFDLFRDHLVMEHRRAASTHLPLSLLVVQLEPASQLSGKEENDTAFGDAAKALIRKLRPEDSIYHLCPGIFAIVLPGVDVGNAYRISTRLTESLLDVSGVSTRFLFDLHVLNYPQDASSAREMEEAAWLLSSPVPGGAGSGCGVNDPDCPPPPRAC